MKLQTLKGFQVPILFQVECLDGSAWHTLTTTVKYSKKLSRISLKPSLDENENFEVQKS